MSIKYADAILKGADLVFKKAATSAVLDTPEINVRLAANGKDILVNTISMSAPAPYNRATGFVGGSISNVWKTIEPTYEVGRRFLLDIMDEVEAHLDAAVVSGVYVSDEETPMIDAIRFNAIASKVGITEIGTPAALTTGAAVLAALKVAVNKLDEDEVPEEGRKLFITPTLLGLAKGAAVTATDLEVLALFDEIVKVPQTRFYKGIDVNDGVTPGQEDGGYAKASTGKDINFLIVHKDAVVQINKHRIADMIEPKFNNDGDGWIMKFRAYGYCDVLPNKLKGVYSHIKNS